MGHYSSTGAYLTAKSKHVKTMGDSEQQSQMTNLNYTPLKIAATEGNYDALVALENGADNEPFDFYSVLACAVARGHVKIVNLLSRSGADRVRASCLGHHCKGAWSET